MADSFFDSDILIYLVSDDPGKADKTESLLAQGGVISVQVLNEVANVARRKMRFSWADTNLFLTSIRGFLQVESLTVDIHETGLDVAERHRLSIHDAMIVAAALHAGCGTLLSEDMQHGMVFERQLRIVNPFQAAA